VLAERSCARALCPTRRPSPERVRTIVEVDDILLPPGRLRRDFCPWPLAALAHEYLVYEVGLVGRSKA